MKGQPMNNKTYKGIRLTPIYRNGRLALEFTTQAGTKAVFTMPPAMDQSAQATLINGETIAGKLTNNHAAASYGQAIFIDNDNQAIDWINIKSLEVMDPAPAGRG